MRKPSEPPTRAVSTMRTTPSTTISAESTDGRARPARLFTPPASRRVDEHAARARLQDVVDGGAEDRRRAGRCPRRGAPTTTSSAPRAPLPRRSPGPPAARARAAGRRGRRSSRRTPAPRRGARRPPPPRPGRSASSGSSSGTSSTWTTAIVAPPLGREPRGRDQRLLRLGRARRRGRRSSGTRSRARARARSAARARSRASGRVDEAAPVDRVADEAERRASRCPPSAWPAPGRRSRARR